LGRENAIKRALDYIDGGGFLEELGRRISIPTESQNPERREEICQYLEGEISPCLEQMGFSWQLLENPVVPRLPFLVAERKEDERAPTVLMYAHGDTVLGMDREWSHGRSPWTLAREGDKLFGRGTADNKGQHTLNLAALGFTLQEKGSLGFNVKFLMEMGEEIGSPGLHSTCQSFKERLGADVLIASDGPRITPNVPTVFGGSRGVFNFDLRVSLREGSHHSGNWGGLLANPGIILCHALASMVDRKGRILVKELRPREVPHWVREALSKITSPGEGGPPIDQDWGEPDLSPAEKVYAWSTLEVLAFETGNPSAPAHAIPPSAWARCHVRFVADQKPEEFLPAIRSHLNSHGFTEVEVIPVRENWTNATRMRPDHPWTLFVMKSLEKTTGKRPEFLPNLGGTLPNDAFSEVLGLPTLWIPHSYGGCCQHAPNEHMLVSLAREAVMLMTGLFWDLGNEGPGVRKD